MKSQHGQSSKIVFAMLTLSLLLASLACRLGFNTSDDSEAIELEQTRVALQQTQVALDALAQDAASEEPVVETEEPVEPTADTNKGITFSYGSSIAANITPEIIPGQNMGEDYMPGDTYPTYTKFTFENYAVADHFHTPVINIYPVAEFRAISTSASDIIDNLQTTLADQPSGGSLSHLPFLPMWNAAQMFSADVTYFDFQNGSGVRYLTMYGQALYPVDNQNLFYTYQGLTNDGQYYIAAVLPVTNPGLPDDGSTVIGDWYEFDQNWDNYIADMLAWLNGQDGDSFSPSLNALDELMASFQINP